MLFLLCLNFPILMHFTYMTWRTLTKKSIYSCTSWRSEMMNSSPLISDHSNVFMWSWKHVTWAKKRWGVRPVTKKIKRRRIKKGKQWCKKKYVWQQGSWGAHTQSIPTALGVKVSVLALRAWRFVSDEHAADRWSGAERNNWMLIGICTETEQKMSFLTCPDDVQTYGWLSRHCVFLKVKLKKPRVTHVQCSDAEFFDIEKIKSFFNNFCILRVILMH